MADVVGATVEVKMDPSEEESDGKVQQDSRDDDSCHTDSGLLNMLAEVASATLHNDSLARKTRNPRGRPRKQVTEGRPEPEPETSDANKLSLAQLQLLTEKQLVDLFSTMDSDEIRRTFSYSCHLVPRCQFTSSSFGSEMKSRQEMQKHLSEHVRDLMKKAENSVTFRFTATPVASKVKKIPAALKEATRVSPTRKPKEKTMKVKIQTTAKKSVPPPVNPPTPGKGPRGQAKKPIPASPVPAKPTRQPVRVVKEDSLSPKRETPGRRKRRSAVQASSEAEEENAENPLLAGIEIMPEEGTNKDKWMKLYHDKYRAVDEADLSQDGIVAVQEYGEVAEEVVVTSEDPVVDTTPEVVPATISLPDHDYNIYRANKKSKLFVAPDVSGDDSTRNQDEQMEAVAQSVAAAAQEKEKQRRKKGGQTQQSNSIPLHSFMLEETTKQSKVVVKNKPTEPLPCVGSEVVVGYNPNEFYLMKSSELPVIEDLRQQKATPTETNTNNQTQYTFVCMDENGALLDDAVEDPSILFDEDEEHLLEQVAAQASGIRRQLGDIPDKDMVDIARKRAKVKPKFVSQSAGERELALQYIGELKQQRGSGADSLHCKICTPVRTFTAPTTLLSHYRSHAGIKPYECRRCGAVFTRQHSLNYHMLIHANMSRFTCPDCHRQFRHPSHYKEHRRRHTGEAPYECSDCMQRFRTRNSYKRHLMTRHGKLLTSTGGLIILPEEEFNKVRCKPRPVRASRSGDAVASISDPATPSSSKENTATKTEGKARVAKGKAAEADGSGNFEQQRQEDLIRLLYQRLTSPNEHSSADSGESRSGSPIPEEDITVASTTEVVPEDQVQLMEVEHHVVVESPEVAAAVVVENIPTSEDQVVEEQCEVVTEESWGSFVHLTVDGQNNVIFLDESQVAAEAEAVVDGTATVVIDQPAQVPIAPTAAAPRQRNQGNNKGKVARKSVPPATTVAGNVSPLAASSTGEVDLLSFVHNAGVMVQHILDIQSDGSAS